MLSEDETAELERLRRLLAARDGKPGWKTNVAMLRDRIAELEARDRQA